MTKKSNIGPAPAFPNQTTAPAGARNGQQGARAANFGGGDRAGEGFLKMKISMRRLRMMALRGT